MTKSIFMDKYPIYSLEIQKDETDLKSVDEILAYYKSKIDKHEIATFITVFNHFEHTTNIDGVINPEIKNAKNIVFCFGAAIPSTKMLAVRPRSIGVAEKENSFVVEFMEAPKEKINNAMISWSQDIVKK